MQTTKKEFDCIAMKREGSLRIHAAVKDLSFDEKLAYWAKRSEEMLQAIKNARKKKVTPR